MSIIRYALQRLSHDGYWEDVLDPSQTWLIASMMGYVTQHPESRYRIVRRKVVETVLWERVIGDTDDRE